VAISFKLFGVSEWAARLPSALAALGCLLLVYRFARRQWGSLEALWSCLVLATSIEFYLFARLAISDMSLTLFLSWALFSFYAAAQADDMRSKLFHSLLMYAAFGVGTLIKGPIAIVLPGLVIFVYLLVTGQWSLLLRLSLLRGVLIFCVIVAPWYLCAEAKNPGYLRYFLVEEHFFRYLTPQFNRSEGWYYFFIVFGAGFLPWNFLLPQMIRNHWKRNFDEANLFLALWAILPFIFFSLSKSKLPQYILPMYPALALLMGRFLAETFSGLDTKRWGVLTMPWLFMIGNVAYLLLGAAWPSILAPQIREGVVSAVWSLAACGALLSIMFGVFLTGRYRIAWSRWRASYLTTAMGSVIFSVVLGHLMIGASQARGSKSLAQAAAPFIAPEHRIAFYDTYLTGILFYLAVDKPLWLAQDEGKERIMGSNYLATRHPPIAAAEQGQVVFSFGEFATQWSRKDLVLRVIVKEKNLRRLSRDVGGAPRILTKHDEYLLVTNH
jgi:4-amino-4-deoxy-L-arabinose transferase-like glycosyltransferase